MYCMSISHKKAPVAVRERFTFSKEEKTELLGRLKACPDIAGAVVLCTCNRSEFYVSGTKKALEVLQETVAEFKGVRLEELLQYLNLYSGGQAVAHIYKVCCGLDSMVLGEDEILGQVKDAYQMTMEEKAADYEINVVFQKALMCAKRIKTDTNLSRTPVSVGTLAANAVFRFDNGSGPAKRVLVIGVTGKMGGIIAKNILSKPGYEIYGTVRSHNADLDMEWRSDRIHLVDYARRYEYMDQADVVISATSGPHYTVVRERLEEALTERKERLFIDVAVPMDVDPQIGRLPGVTLYDIDYFEQLSKSNNQMKLKELDAAREILEEELDECRKEILFHSCFPKLERWKAAFERMPLENILFRIRDHVSSGELEVIVRTFDQLEEWMEE